MGSSDIPRVKFNNGSSCPILGLGTWQSPPNEVEEAVKVAIDCGYRHIDCAFSYCNEHEVGTAIQAKIKDGAVKRTDLFITSKLWATCLNPKVVMIAVKKSLENLKLDYLDLYLMHWPVAFKEGDELTPKDADGKMLFSDIDYLDTWKAMEDLVEKGLVKSIGVSNFNIDQLKRVIANGKIVPAVNQIEMHPILAQKPMNEFCKGQEIVLTAYSPLGSPGRPMKFSGDPHLLSEPTVVSIAEKKNKTPSQILIRYHIENGNMVIPKSTNKSRIEANFQVFDFKLSPQEMGLLEKMNKERRFVRFPAIQAAKNYPFTDLLG